MPDLTPIRLSQTFSDALGHAFEIYFLDSYCDFFTYWDLWEIPLQYSFDNNDIYPLSKDFYILDGNLVRNTSSHTYHGDYSDCSILKAPKGLITLKFYYDGIADWYQGIAPFYSDPL